MSITKEVAPFPTDSEDLDRFAGVLLYKRLGSFGEVCVEGSAQTFIGRDQYDDISFIGAKVQQRMMEVFISSLR
jgi:hypothetical protein